MSEDAWKPAAPMRHMRRRAELYQAIRAFFEARGSLEVDTPMLSVAMNPDRHVESLSVNMPDRPRYLHTSPEFPMKRLLAAGSGPIWQLCRVFRRGELGARHNPEFTMLEWYQPGFDEHDLMSEVAALLRTQRPGLTDVRLTYRAAFQRYAGFDPLAEPLDALAARTRERFDWKDSERSNMLDLWLSEVVEPAFDPDVMTFVYDWPADSAALAQLHEDCDGHRVARRFELFWRGMELANGYYELTDADEQRRRFEAEQARRARDHQTLAPLDEHLDQAMRAGLPDSAGVAMGVDRWLMALTEVTTLPQVLAFPFDRA